MYNDAGGGGAGGEHYPQVIETSRQRSVLHLRIRFSVRMNRVSEQYNKLHCIAHHDDSGGAAWFAKCCSGELKQWPGGGVLKRF